MRDLALALLASILATAPISRIADAEEFEAEIDRLAAQVEPQVIAWRRDIHQHPELSNREVRTAKLVADHLEALGIEVRREIAHTGVVGLLRGGMRGGVVALRADMDALPFTEEVDIPFASKVRTRYLGREVGVMHACGHDAHTAILLGVAEVLTGVREKIPGSVLFLFQPAEEGAPPGEEGGARLMLEEGAFANPEPDAVFGLHVAPQYRAGEIAYRAGGAMAGSDKLEISVRGKQTHAAYPWLGVDPIAESAGASVELEITIGYPVTYNDPQLTARMEPTLRRVAGSDRLLGGLPRTGAEDFSFLSQKAPGLYFWLGARSPDVAERDAAPNHSPLFRVDESTLVLGVRALANLTVDFLTMETAAETR